MPRKHVIAGVALASLALTALGANSHHAPHWGYTGDDGPSHWAKLSPEYGKCAGLQQSPVDLDHFHDVDLPGLALHYRGGAKDILNNGHTVQADFAPGSTITLDGTTFTLKQVHVHLPSEHTLHG